MSSRSDLYDHLRSPAEARMLASPTFDASLSVGEKVDLVARYLAAHPRLVLIETGLWEGWGTTMRLVESWPKTTTVLENRRHVLIDWNERNCELARERCPHAEVIFGDSARELPKVLETLDEPAFFWIDAHDDESPTSPLWTELSAIVSHAHVREHVVLVDDARMMGSSSAGIEPWAGFPTLERVLWLGEPYWNAEVAADVLRFTPRTTTEGGSS